MLNANVSCRFKKREILFNTFQLEVYFIQKYQMLQMAKKYNVSDIQIVLHYRLTCCVMPFLTFKFFFYN